MRNKCVFRAERNSDNDFDLLTERGSEFHTRWLKKHFSGQVELDSTWTSSTDRKYANFFKDKSKPCSSKHSRMQFTFSRTWGTKNRRPWQSLLKRSTSSKMEFGKADTKIQSRLLEFVARSSSHDGCCLVEEVVHWSDHVSGADALDHPIQRNSTEQVK